MAPSLVVIAGTGTDVGKTFVTCALAAALRRRGVAVSAWKPLASGVTPGMEGPDSAALSAALGSTVAPPLHEFVEPLSPHLAARRAGVEIRVEAVVERARELSAGCAVLLVETAGGLFSPLAPGVTNADLTAALLAPGAGGAARGAWMLVAPDRIGVIHDVSAALLAARSRGMAPGAVALSAPALPDASSGTNADEIATTTGQRVAAVFARGVAGDAASDQAAAALWAALAG